MQVGSGLEFLRWGDSETDSFGQGQFVKQLVQVERQVPETWTLLLNVQRITNPVPVTNPQVKYQIRAGVGSTNTLMEYTFIIGPALFAETAVSMQGPQPNLYKVFEFPASSFQVSAIITTEAPETLVISALIAPRYLPGGSPDRFKEARSR